MASTLHSSFERSLRSTANPADHHRAYRLLYTTFVLLPIVVGFDKFFNAFTDWPKYVAPAFANILPFGAATFMLLVGVVEIAAGTLVALRSRLGGYVVAGWLGVVALNLVLAGYFDIALRDLGLMIGALALARLSPRRLL